MTCVSHSKQISLVLSGCCFFFFPQVLYNWNYAVNLLLCFVYKTFYKVVFCLFHMKPALEWGWGTSPWNKCRCPSLTCHSPAAPLLIDLVTLWSELFFFSQYFGHSLHHLLKSSTVHAVMENHVLEKLCPILESAEWGTLLETHSLIRVWAETLVLH